MEHLAKQLPLLNDAVGERWRIAGQLSDDTGASDKYFVDRIFQVAWQHVLAPPLPVHQSRMQLRLL